MKNYRVIVSTLLSLLAFAGNSLLCRLALGPSAGIQRIDPASFTAIRLAAGAVVLAAIVWLRGGKPLKAGNWLSALALFVYAAGFSLAYACLPTATGALLLFGAVQGTMIGWGLWKGEKLRPWQVIGLICAGAGLVVLLLPGLKTPPWQGAALMLSAGIAWGVYSLRGKGAGDATAVTAGNFCRATLLAAGLSVVMLSKFQLESRGISLAIASGAITSGLGYVIWYTALPSLPATTAATVQLSVPLLSAMGAVFLLGESLLPQQYVAGGAILGGIGLVIWGKKS